MSKSKAIRRVSVGLIVPNVKVRLSVALGMTAILPKLTWQQKIELDHPQCYSYGMLWNSFLLA